MEIFKVTLMSDEKFVSIGKIHSAQGIRGELFVHIFSGEAEWMDQWHDLHWSEKVDTVPKAFSKITSKRVHEKQKKWGFALRLDEVKDRNDAEAWVGRKVYVPESFLVSEEGEEIYLREVLGFRVMDETRGDVGEVVGFSGSAWQDLLVIKNQDGEFEVPFVEPILIETKKDEKILVMDIPQGLVAGEEL